MGKLDKAESLVGVLQCRLNLMNISYRFDQRHHVLDHLQTLLATLNK